MQNCSHMACPQESHTLVLSHIFTPLWSWIPNQTHTSPSRNTGGWENKPCTVFTSGFFLFSLNCPPPHTHKCEVPAFPVRPQKVLPTPCGPLHARKWRAGGLHAVDRRVAGCLGRLPGLLSAEMLIGGNPPAEAVWVAWPRHPEGHLGVKY